MGLALLSEPVFGQAPGRAKSAPTPKRMLLRVDLATSEKVLEQYVEGVNASDFEAQYALFASVEPTIRGDDPQPIPLLPKQALRQLLARFDPAFLAGLQLSPHPHQALMNDAKGRPEWIAGYMIPIVKSARSAPGLRRDGDTYLVALQPTSQGWKVRALATYWVYFDRTYGSEVGKRFCDAYREELQRLRLGTSPSGPSQRP
jgi:hypothetical protein